MAPTHSKTVSPPHSRPRPGRADGASRFANESSSSFRKSSVIGFGATALHSSHRSHAATATSSRPHQALNTHVQRSRPVGDAFTGLNDRRRGVAVREIEHGDDVVGRGGDEPRAERQSAAHEHAHPDFPHGQPDPVAASSPAGSSATAASRDSSRAMRRAPSSISISFA